MSIEGPRAAAVAEIPAVVKLANSVFRPRGDASMGDQFPLLFAPGNAGNLRIFADDGRPISLVGMFVRDVRLAGTEHRACCIGSVCTEPESRGQGLASRLLDDARARAIADGCDLFLISGGRGLYTRQGFTDVGGYRRAVIDPAKLPEKTGLRARSWKPEDLPALMHMHSAEPVRFARTPQDYLAMLECGRVDNGAADTRLVRAGQGQPLAAFTYRLPGQAGLEEDEVSVDEMSGSRWALVQALRAVCEEHGASRAFIEYLDSDAEMVALARGLKWKVERRGFRGTVGIIEPERFWQACAPLFEERLGAERFEGLRFVAAGGPRIEYGKEKLKLDGMTGLTRLVFLPADRRGELSLGLAAGSELAGVLAELFPLPLVSYGLNYV
jgi:predicted N-acetyltransferase YhbS